MAALVALLTGNRSFLRLIRYVSADRARIRRAVTLGARDAYFAELSTN